MIVLFGGKQATLTLQVGLASQGLAEVGVSDSKKLRAAFRSVEVKIAEKNEQDPHFFMHFFTLQTW